MSTAPKVLIAIGAFAVGLIVFESVWVEDDWVPQRLVTATGPNPLPR